ncbi:hypothetical protein HYZ97_04205 [Candidatus Pacearchaeota archaeon]|nr:hypothetical protein [Candidatus Pacearchaeota archaeon]
MHKRGLSPVIATVLLISIALLLAAIIFLWARGFLIERNIKFDQPIEDACGDISFDAEAFAEAGETRLAIVNRGNVPIYGVELQESSEGDISNLGVARCGEIGSERTIRNGETCSMIISATTGQELYIVPMILGEQGIAKAPYTCLREQGQRITVQ